MKKIIIICKRPTRIEKKLAVFFNAWLMDQIPDQTADVFHRSGDKPYTIHAEATSSELKFIVSLLKEKKVQEITTFFDNFSKDKIVFNSVNEEFKIRQIKKEECSEKDLTERFYQEDAARIFNLDFISPTAFKSQNSFIFLPDIRLIFQSLMRKYEYVFSDTDHVDVELLDQIIQSTRIKHFKIKSEYYSIHQAFIPGFKGKIKLSCSGPQTLVNYVNLLLKFGEYAGIGVKTGLGMGAVLVNQDRKKDGENG
ncbi:CRISPR-associated endoribonuclease Cas6 [Lentilactobacillus parakefiri]|uniref:CRISPR-associated endoribonuclease Cas6 n=1 Tax=Lentilactobacillus parakefiri TaxID=152332 RepID=UPI00117ADAD4|nr:CRISPR-associated endoribonuclease Cas6 [Lentilactobacillus parakefiri]